MDETVTVRSFKEPQFDYYVYTNDSGMSQLPHVFRVKTMRVYYLCYFHVTFPSTYYMLLDTLLILVSHVFTARSYTNYGNWCTTHPCFSRLSFWWWSRTPTTASSNSTSLPRNTLKSTIVSCNLRWLCSSCRFNWSLNVNRSGLILFFFSMKFDSVLSGKSAEGLLSIGITITLSYVFFCKYESSNSNGRVHIHDGVYFRPYILYFYVNHLYVFGWQ